MSKTIHLYRVIAGRRVRFRFTLDDADTITEEKVDAPLAVDAPDAREQLLLARGVGFERTPSGILITSVPEREMQILKFFAPQVKCWFPGCEQLHAEYLIDLAKLGTGCPACDRGRLNNRYREKIEALA